MICLTTIIDLRWLCRWVLHHQLEECCESPPFNSTHWCTGAPLFVHSQTESAIHNSQAQQTWFSWLASVSKSSGSNPFPYLASPKFILLVEIPGPNFWKYTVYQFCPILFSSQVCFLWKPWHVSRNSPLMSKQSQQPPGTYICPPGRRV